MGTKEIRWARVAREERGREYVDHVAGTFRIAQGYDEPARREGRPWTLFERDRYVATFATVAEAKARAGAAPEGAIPSRRRRVA